MIGIKTETPDLIEWIDLSRIHVHAPTTVVLLCGGQIEITSPTPISFRDAFTRITHQRPFSRYIFRLAEEANLYAYRAAYTNWQDFETDLAEVCQLVMLFCESEGSIAELGAFAIIDEIARKLLVIIDEINHKGGSYITLGVIAALDERYGRSSVYVLNYSGLNIDSNTDLEKLDLGEFSIRFSRVLPEYINKHRDPRTFDPSRPGHLIKLVVGFIQHFGALTLTEIGVILSSLNLQQEDRRLRQFLECARFLEWIDVTDRGNETFFVALKPKDAIEYRLSDGSPNIDKASWRALVRQYWKEREPERFASIVDAAGA